MKIYLTVDITKGLDTWNEMVEELNHEMVSVGGKNLFSRLVKRTKKDSLNHGNCIIGKINRVVNQTRYS